MRRALAVIGVLTATALPGLAVTHAQAGPAPPAAAYLAPMPPRTTATIIRSDAFGLRVKVDFGPHTLTPIRLDDGRTYQDLTVASLESPEGQFWHPSIPRWRTSIALPHGATARIAIAAVTTATVGIPGAIAPTPILLAPVRDYGDPGERTDETAPYERPPFAPDPDAYRSPGPIPQALCDVGTGADTRGVQLAALSCTSAQYQPSAGRVVLVKSVEFEVTFSGGRGGPDAFNAQPTIHAFDSASRFQYGTAFNRGVIAATTKLPQQLCTGAELLILSPPDLKPAAEQLKLHKESMGLATFIRTVADGGAGGPDTTATIDALVENEYNNCTIRPSYLLILGDADRIPTFYVPRTYKLQTNPNYAAESPQQYWLASDQPYAAVPANSTVTEQVTPDIAVGRLPAKTLAQAQTMIDKIVSYESDPPFPSAIGGFYKTAAVAAQFQCCDEGAIDSQNRGTEEEGFIRAAEKIAKPVFDDNGWTTTRLYRFSEFATTTTVPGFHSDGTPLAPDIGPGSGFVFDADTEDITKAINGGRVLAIHIDHGSPSGWATPSLQVGSTTENAVEKSLTNGELLPVMYSINCSAGGFDTETDIGAGTANDTHELFGETMVRKAGGGAIGHLGYSRIMNTGTGRAHLKALLDATFPGTLPDFGPSTPLTALGDILTHTKLYYQQVKSADDLFGMAQNHMFNLLGDPSLRIYLDDPYELPDDIVWEEFNPFIRVFFPRDGADITIFQELADGTRRPIGRGTVKAGTVDVPKLVEPLATAQAVGSTSRYVFVASAPGAVPVVLNPATHFAEGTIRPGFVEYLTLQNPGARDALATVVIQAANDAGAAVPVAPLAVSVPAGRRVTVNINEAVAAQGVAAPIDVSLVVRPDRPVIAERPIYFSADPGLGKVVSGGTTSSGLPAPALVHRFAEGTVRPGFVEYVTLQNPGSAAVGVVVAAQAATDTGALVPIPPKSLTLAPSSRTTVNINQLVGPGPLNVSVKVTATGPIVAERPMYFAADPALGTVIDGGTTAAGVGAAAYDFAFAEGTIRRGFVEYLTLQNAEDVPGTARIEVQAANDSGAPVAVAPFTVNVAGQSRMTVNLTQRLTGGQAGAASVVPLNVSVRVTSSVAIVAERPMYFSADPGLGALAEDGTTLAGVTSPSQSIRFAEGTVRSGFVSYLTLQNPGAVAGTATISLQSDRALAPISVALAARSRTTVNLNERLAGSGVLDVSAAVHATVPIVAERPVYFATDPALGTTVSGGTTSAGDNP